jgi:hypothetical protein
MMKKLFIFLFIAFYAHFGHSQVFSGSQEIDKNKREGAYILTVLDQKFVDKIWQAKLSTLGKQNVSKGGITINNVKLENISADPITIYSKVTKQKDRTQVFMAAVLANGEILTNGHEKWSALESYLTDFQNQLVLENGVKTAENEQNDAMDNHKKVIKAGDKLTSKIEDNKKEKEKLLKKIEENRIELEKLLTDVESNKKDQIKALDDIEVKKKGVDEAKMKLPK